MCTIRHAFHCLLYLTEKYIILYSPGFSSPNSNAESTSSSAEGPKSGDTLYSDAFATYLAILKDHEDEIKAYDWQCGYDDAAADYNKPVAVQNILGDDTPELIFIHDRSAEHGAHIAQVLKELKADENNN